MSKHKFELYYMPPESDDHYDKAKNHWSGWRWYPKSDSRHIKGIHFKWRHYFYDICKNLFDSVVGKQ